MAIDRTLQKLICEILSGTLAPTEDPTVVTREIVSMIEDYYEEKHERLR
jgi:hypothetical protein